MKSAISFRLSDESKNILKTKSLAFNMSKTAILECIIREFSPSTNDEKLHQIRDRNKAFIFFMNTHPNPTIKNAWGNGFKAGWEQFQTRKFSSLFKSKSI